MIDWIQVFVLSFVQGITEFLPISSSAHLILVPKLLGWEDQGLAFDVAVHVGTLAAVLIYFRREIYCMFQDFFRSFTGQPLTPYAKLFWFLGFATIPVGLAGLFGKSIIENTLRSPIVIAYTTILFGFLLLLSERLGKNIRDTQNVSWKDATVIGISQAFALIPGTSRAGVTLTAGMAMGLTRTTAAQFSFLLAVPAILLAGGYEAMTLIKQSSTMTIPWAQMLVGMILSGISGYFCIYYFMKLLIKIGVWPFVMYRFCLGIVLLSLFW